MDIAVGRTMKRGYLGLFEGIYVAGQSHALQIVFGKSGDAASHIGVPLNKMLYVAAFQGGIERFITPLNPTSDDPIDQFVSARTSVPKESDRRLRETLVGLHPASPRQSYESRGWMAPYFVLDLIAAMENNAAMINVSGIPNEDDVRRDLPPDIALPICTLLSAVRRTDELLPAPSQIVSRETVGRFKELLSSEVYRRYATAQERVEFDVGTSALADIRAKGSELLRLGRGLLSNRHVSMHTISIVPKIVDAAFGKLPGAMAQFAGDLASKYIGDRKNIVIYRFDNWVKEYLNATVSYYHRHRTEVTE